MPTFCRHNRLVQNCPICAREQDVEMRPVVSTSRHGEPRAASAGPAARPAAVSGGTSAPRSGTRSRMTVRRLTREAGDGYGSALIPGVHSVADAERLAEELAFAATRLQVLTADPPGLYAEVVDAAEPLEERAWLAVLIALLAPLEVPSAVDGEARADGPFSAIARIRGEVTWASGEIPDFSVLPFGPRGIGDVDRARRVCEAYRAWAARQGSQTAGLAGEAGWTAERRFDRAFERLGTLAAMDRGVRYDLLATLGRLGVYDLRGNRLHVGGSDPVTLAAKRILGIGDPLLLERRVADLAEACQLPIEVFDLGFFNWERRSRYAGGVDPALPADPVGLASARAALGL